jgi:rubrerythrin
VDGSEIEFLTKMHLLTIVAAEQQTMNLYMNVGNRPTDPLGRGLYLEIAQIEEQHVSHYESLLDPTADWFERLVLHEYNEAFLYYSCMETETDERIRDMWEFHMRCEIQHLHDAVELLDKHGEKSPEDVLPESMPEPLVTFESNVDYVRKIEAEQVDWTTDGTEIVEGDEAPARYREFQKKINSGRVPSQAVIEEHVATHAQDYRLCIDGEHPVERFRDRESAVR